MNILLIAIVLILAGFGLSGMQKGLIKMVFSLVSTVVALACAVLFSSTLADMLRSNTMVHDFLTENVGIVLELFVPEAQSITDYMENLPLPEVIKDMLQEESGIADAVSTQTAAVSEYVCERIVNVTINCVAFAATFLVALVALVCLCHVLDLVSKLPVLDQVNRMAGLAVGLVEGVIVIWIFFVVLTMFTGTEFGQTAMQMINENAFLSFLYNHNLLVRFVIK